MKSYLITLFLLFFINVYATTLCFAKELNHNFSGLLQSLYKNRTLSDNLGTDHQFTQFLDIELNELERKGFSIYFSGDLTVGDQTQTGNIFNTWDKSYHAAIYQLSSEISFFHENAKIEVGRLFVNKAFDVHIDGFRLLNKFSNGNGHICIYTGMPVRYYDDVIFTDSTQAVTSIQFNFKSLSTLNIEYQYLKEEPDCFDNGSSEDIHQVAVSFNQYIQKIGKLYVSGETMNDRIDNIKGNLSLLFERIGLMTDMTCKYQFEKIDERPISESLFVDVSRPVEPYYYVNFNFNKTFDSYPLELYAGLTIRKLEHQEQESDFNHSFIHENLGLIIHNLFSLDLMLHLKTDIWHETGEGKNDFITGGYDITYRPEQNWCLKTGLDYSLYRYDYYMDLNEKDHIYSIYAEALRKQFMNTDVKFRYSLDMYDLNEHRINVTSTYFF